MPCLAKRGDGDGDGSAQTPDTTDGAQRNDTITNGDGISGESEGDGVIIFLAVVAVFAVVVAAAVVLALSCAVGDHFPAAAHELRTSASASRAHHAVVRRRST